MLLSTEHWLHGGQGLTIPLGYPSGDAKQELAVCLDLKKKPDVGLELRQYSAYCGI